MEFFAGIVFAFFIGVIGTKIYESRKRSKAWRDFIPPAGSGFDDTVDVSEFKKRQDL